MPLVISAFAMPLVWMVATFICNHVERSFITLNYGGFVVPTPLIVGAITAVASVLTYAIDGQFFHYFMTFLKDEDAPQANDDEVIMSQIDTSESDACDGEDVCDGDD
jgi:hypothetical protein